MDYALMIELGHYFNQFKIINISKDTNFWMIRSKGGYFYDEFVTDKFVALGWNYINKDTSFNSKDVVQLKDEIQKRYGDKRPGVAVSKCDKFINEVKEGDYVLIPNEGGSEVAVGILGEYYETDFDYVKEILTIQKIENKEAEIGRAKCPYKKRRHMNVIMRIDSKRLGYKILKGMASYHGISNLNEYATDILNCIYDCYEYKDNIMCSINVSKTDPIKAREMSRLMFYITELYCNVIDEELISITANLNSPGKVTVRLQEGCKALKKAVRPLIGVFLLVFGGSGLGFEFPGIASGVINSIRDYKLVNTEVELEKENLKGKQLDNYLKTIEVIQKAEESGVDVDNILRIVEDVNKLNTSLQFESNKEFAKIKTDKVESEEK